jgi:hypothetical protein
MINPYIQYKGLEFFGTYERSQGKITGEAQDTRTWSQLHGELIYRFGENDNIYVGGKYNRAAGELPNFNPTADPTEVTIDRFAFAAGWYMTKNILVKAEYVTQNYDGFNSGVLQGGQFDGVMLEAVLSF